MNALTLVHETISRYIREGAVCIDATAGRGYDTAFLCSKVSSDGKVTAMDVQQCAIDSTAALLKSKGLHARLIVDSHENMAKYADKESVDCIVFNLGYLPGGDHKINTRWQSTVKAIEAGLSLLKSGGLMCITLYYGGDSGYEERDYLLDYFKTVDDSKYQVLVTSFYNWKKDPPIPVFIVKEETNKYSR